MLSKLKKKIYILSIFQNIIHTVKDNLFYSFNDFKWRRMTLSCSKNHSEFYCLNCLLSFTTENKREYHKKVCEIKMFCSILMPSEDKNILEFNQYQKSDKSPFIIYADLECIIEKIDVCKNNHENSVTRKVSEYIPSGFSMSAIFSFKSIENKQDVCQSLTLSQAGGTFWPATGFKL